MITDKLANLAANLVAGTNATELPRLEPGHRVYAIGDVHGHLLQLQAMHDAIREDLANRPASRPVLVHMGDLIDRGPSSAGVLDLLEAGEPLPGVPTVNLMGNHEWMFLTALAGQSKREAEHWLDNGGIETLQSWGIRPSTPPAQWPDLVPRSHVMFLRGLAARFERGGYVFVHAGVRPGVPLSEQTWSDLLWIREPFLERRGPLLPDAPDAVVVHGHTPEREPVIRENRIGIDTGAGRGGPLTCAVLDEDDVRFLQASLLDEPARP